MQKILNELQKVS